MVQEIKYFIEQEICCDLSSADYLKYKGCSFVYEIIDGSIRISDFDDEWHTFTFEAENSTEVLRKKLDKMIEDEKYTWRM